MSDVKMPKWLRDAVVERADKELLWGQALPYDDEHDSDVTYGANICYAALLDCAPDDDFATLVGEGIGEASMCWSEAPTGIFDSSRAKAVADRIIARHAQDAAQIAALKAENERLREYAEQYFDSEAENERFCEWMNNGTVPK